MSADRHSRHDPQLRCQVPARGRHTRSRLCSSKKVSHRGRGIGAVAGLLQPGSDVGDARWVALEDLYELDITKQAGELARRWLQQRA